MENKSVAIGFAQPEIIFMPTHEQEETETLVDLSRRFDAGWGDNILAELNDF